MSSSTQSITLNVLFRWKEGQKVVDSDLLDGSVRVFEGRVTREGSLE